MKLSDMLGICNRCDYAPSFCGMDKSDCARRGFPASKLDEDRCERSRNAWNKGIMTEQATIGSGTSQRAVQDAQQGGEVGRDG